MKVLIAGATGFVGARLVLRLLERNDQVLVLTRDPAKVKAGTPLSWDAFIQAPPAEVDAVVNLSGENLFARRWNSEFKELIRNSRVEATRRLVAAVGTGEFRPKTLVNASAIGIYGPHGDETLAEDASAGSDFLSGVCRDWEAEARTGEEKGMRVVLLRISVVLGRDGGALRQMLPPFKMFAGGPVGSGAQWFSWIHIDDLVGLILLALDHPQVTGPLNATAPDPRTNREFSAALGRALGRPSWLPMPGFALRLLVGEVAEIILAGQRVLPKRAQELGFVFRFPTVDAALADLVN